MDDIYIKLFFLLCGAFLAWIGNRLAERSKADREERVHLRTAYANWFASSRSFILSFRHSLEHFDQATGRVSSPEELSEELERLSVLGENIANWMYQSYFLERVDAVRENTRLLTDILDKLQVLLNRLRQSSIIGERGESILVKANALLERPQNKGSATIEIESLKILTNEIQKDQEDARLKDTAYIKTIRDILDLFQIRLDSTLNLLPSKPGPWWEAWYANRSFRSTKLAD